ncbi:FAD-dependent oxidoreductase [Streptomyces sp. NPDC048448]|uniref:FAD-dependent oxidoreductase n=1 Tax=Streptomyces sp. NPDC048448 TaxID=3365554 RepID=UPI003718C8D4
MADVPVDGWRAVVRIRVRRLVCPVLGCRRQTFREQVPRLIERLQRRTTRLTRQVSEVVKELCGRAASRLTRSRFLATPLSYATVLRLPRRIALPTVRSPRVSWGRRLRPAAPPPLRPHPEPPADRVAPRYRPTLVDPYREHLRQRDGEVRITLSDGGQLAADEILLATGRAPQTRDVGLESVGLTPGDWLAVDDTFQVTGVDGGWLYAVGDVNHRALMTHQGKYQARIAGTVIGARAKGEPIDDAPWGAHVATADHAAVPQVVFTTPEIASVGLTSREAEQSGRRIEVVDYDLAHVAGAHQYGQDYRGRARMLIDTDRNTVVGVTFAGPDVGELVHSATIAVAGEVPLDRFWHAVPAFPTLGEVWLRLLETYRG